MPQVDVSRLVSQLRIKVNPTHRRLKNPKGPEGRHDTIRNILTGLFKYERIELTYTKADESRGYAERVSFKQVLSNLKLWFTFTPDDVFLSWRVKNCN